MHGLLNFVPAPWRIWIIIGSYFVAASVGGWAVHKLHQANQKEKLRLALEKFEKDNAHANQAEVTVDRLPDGEPSRRLFLSWSRAEK